MPRRLDCRLVRLEEVYGLAHRLAREIRGRFAPEVVVAVARGGFVPARLLCDFLGVHALGSLQVRHYASAARPEAGARVVSGLDPALAERRLLVVDDVNDSGDTLVAVREHLEALGARDWRSAVLHEKSATRARADFRAEALERWRWLLYQWALVEDVGGFLAQRDPPPADRAEAAAWLETEYGIVLEEALWEKLAVLGVPPTAPSE